MRENEKKREGVRTEGSRDMDKPFSSLANTSPDRQRHEDFYVLEIASRTLFLYVTDLYIQNDILEIVMAIWLVVILLLFVH